ncbi:hypothetical protein IAQ61_005173 [Plenodomus lingam]|uniref:uncharacterized protein n=1 Tax=Leptosphaeria maculans TaxID=5022 RepID=UPI00332467D1|nr:hypothetical protein IAQ61_005173 [Plenodomus lingam]
MPIKMVNTGRGRGRGRGGGTARGRGGGRGGSKKLSATPAPKATTTTSQTTRSRSNATTRLSASDTPGPNHTARVATAPASSSAQKLKLNFSATRAGSSAGRTSSNTQARHERNSSKDNEKADGEPSAPLLQGDDVDGEHESDDRVPSENIDTGARRSGRVVKKLRHEDFDYGSDVPQAAEPEQKRGKSFKRKCPLKRGRSSRPSPVPKATPQAAPDVQVSSSPTSASPVIHEIHNLQIEPKVLEIMTHVKSSPETLAELPELHNDKNSVTPYTGTQLMHLYLTAHNLKLFDICDLVTDTWIRALHTQRRRDARANSSGLWRPNHVLEKRLTRYLNARNEGRIPDDPMEFERNPPDYNLSVQDPRLDPDVLSFDSTLLGELYTHTPSDCGARRLWSDAITLAGDKAAHMFANSTHRGFVWNQELKDDVMKTSLRMLRRKITLKIEESTEGAWCDRYHEHGKKGICYRAKAAQEARREAEREAERAEEGQVEANAGWSSSSDEDSDGMEDMILKELENDEGDEDREGMGAKRQRLM